jgi:hypothetical protein
MTSYLRGAALIVTAWAALGAPHAVRAQSRHDEQQLLIAQIQMDKSAIVLRSMELDDAQVQAFTPIYDEYQLERKKLFDRTADLLNLYASSYESMTDDTGRKILKNWFALQDDEVELMRKYSRRLEKVLPPARVVRFVQIENKLDTLLRLKAEDKIPLAK